MDPFIISFGPIIGGIVGGIIGALATGLYSDRQDKRAQHQERKGLLVLLSQEIMLNRDTFSLKDVAPSYIASNIQVSVWEDSRVRLADLLTTEEFEALALYYMTLWRMLCNWANADGKLSESHRSMIAEAHTRSSKIISVAQSYVKDSPTIKSFQPAIEVEEAAEDMQK